MPADRTTSYAAQEQERKEDVGTIVAMIDRQKDMYAGILPTSVSFDDFRNAFLIAVQTRPSLLEADRASLWLALRKCAEGGLKPDSVEAALVIFGDDEEDEEGNIVPSKAKGKKKVVYMPMVWGITKQMRNTGNVASVRCKVIYRGERVIVTDENGQETYKHTRVIEEGSGVDETDDNIVGAYAVVAYKDGFWDAEFMSRRQLDRVKAMAKSKRGPWATHFPQQCMKTPLRRLSLRVEKSKENMRYFQAIQEDETLTTIDGVVDAPPPSLEQDQSIRQEFTNASSAAPVGSSKPATKPATKAQPAASGNSGGNRGSGGDTRAGGPGGASHAASNAGAGSGGTGGDSGGVGNAGTVTASAGQQIIEIWAFDDTGEPADQQEPMNAAEFADWFAKRIFISKNPEGLREHNADNISECRAVPEAFAEINDAIGRDIKRRMEAQADAENAAKAKAAAQAQQAQAPKKREPIAVPKTPKGSLHWSNYGALALAEVEKLTTEAEIAEWIALNEPTYRNHVPEIAIGNRIRAKREALGAVPPPDEEPAKEAPAASYSPPVADLPVAAMTDAEFLTAVKAQIPLMATDEELLAWCGQDAVVGRMDDLRKRDKTLWQQICLIIDGRRVEISPEDQVPQ
jgi:recombination protein RecT